MTRARLAFLFPCLILASLGDPPHVQAQAYTSYADIRVKANSAAGPLVPGAYVQVSNSAGRVVSAGYANGRGVFRASQLPEGTYRVSASHRGVGSGTGSFQLRRGAGPALVTVALR